MEFTVFGLKVIFGAVAEFLAYAPGCYCGLGLSTGIGAVMGRQLGLSVVYHAKEGGPVQAFSVGKQGSKAV